MIRLHLARYIHGPWPGIHDPRNVAVSGRPRRSSERNLHWRRRGHVLLLSCVKIDGVFAMAVDEYSDNEQPGEGWTRASASAVHFATLDTHR